MIYETTRDGMKYTLATAAMATGKSKATIHRAVRSGKISSTRTFNGIYEIDSSELHRVFEIINTKQNDTTSDSNDTMMNAALMSQENEFLRQQLSREKELVNNLTTRLDFLESRINSLLLLLTHQPLPMSVSKTTTPPVPPKTSLWKKIFKT
jgi:hypothetical protein